MNKMFGICNLRAKKEKEELEMKNRFLEYKIEDLQDMIYIQSEYTDILSEYMITLYVDETIGQLEEIREEILDDTKYDNDTANHYLGYVDLMIETIKLKKEEFFAKVNKNMTAYKASSILKVRISRFDRATDANMALETAYKALQKQLPQKPLKTDNDGLRYTDEYTFPTCGGNFVGTGIADYCYHCGQALDWEGQYKDRQMDYEHKD